MRKAKKVLFILTLFVMAAVGTGVAIAADGDNVKPANTAFTGTSTNSKLTIGSFSVSCSNSTVSGTTPGSGFGPINITATFGGTCTSSVGTGATVTVSNPWTLTYVDNASEGGTETLGANDGLNIGLQDGGSKGYAAHVVVANPFGNCVINIPGSQTVSSTYNDSTGVATFSNAAVNYSVVSGGFGCPSGSGAGTFNATYSVSPIISDG